MSAVWRTVRVFISSTFRDMHAERDHLVKVVFPELRERLQPHRVELADIDLRWGVTREQAENDQVVSFCLEQVDECRPFFLGLLGGRYGWAPAQLPVDTRRRFPWVGAHAGASVTELEILHSLQNGASRALVCLRTAQSFTDIPVAARPTFIEPDLDALRRLNALKQQVRANGRARTLTYSCFWNPQAFDRPTHSCGRLDGMEEFGRQVETWLWQEIRDELRLPNQPLAFPGDSWAEEADFHERLMEQRGRVYVGRASLDSALHAFARGMAEVPCLVTGASGSGKSAALAHFVATFRRRHPEAFVLANFVGASPRSSSLHHLLGRLCVEWRRHFGLAANPLPDATAERMELFHTLVAAAPAARAVLVIDALNQLDEDDQAHALHWLPERLPPSVKVLVSCLDQPHDPHAVLTSFRKRSVLRLEVPPLHDAERRQILREVPKLSAKTLDDAQIDVLLANPATAYPLFLLVALEELRGFGSFESLNKRIAGLPSGDGAITALFVQVFERLEEEFDRDLVVTVLTLLAAARHGLTEGELQELTTLLPGREDLFPVLRQLRPYLFSRAGLLDFYHYNVAPAVRRKYWSCPDEETHAHRRLAEFFARQPTSLRKADELPWHWQRSADPERLKESLADLDLFSFLQDQKPYELLGYWHGLEGRYDQAQVYADACTLREGTAPDAATKWNEVGIYFKLAGLHDAAEHAYRRGLVLREAAFGPHHPDVAQSLNNLGVLAESRGRFAEAERLMRQAVSVWERTLGPDDIETGRGLNGLGMALYAQARYAEAEPFFRRSLAVRERLLGSDHPETAQSVNNLAMTLSLQGDWPEAERLLRRALSIRVRTLGSEHPDIAVCLNNLGMMMESQARYAEAEAFLTRALAITGKVLGPGHPDHARSLQNLSLLHGTMGDDAAAESLGRQALAICEAVHGSDHPHTNASKTNLAFLMHKRGDPAAVDLLREVLAVTERTLGAQHPDTAISLHNVAFVLDGPVEAGEAVDLFRRALQVSEQALGRAHPQTATMAGSLARRLAKQDELEEAERLLREVLACREGALGPDHPHTVRVLLDLAELRLRREPDEDAVALCRRAAAESERLHGPGHSETSFAASLLAISLARTNRSEEAEAVLRRLVAGLEAAPASPADVLNARIQLGRLLEKRGAKDEAEQLYRQALSICDGSAEADPRHTAGILLRLARLTEARGEMDEAETYYRRELAISEQLDGPDHPDTAASLSNLADLLSQKGQPAEAERLLRRAVAIVDQATGPDHPDLAAYLCDLAEVVAGTDRNEAKAFASRALRICEAARGAEPEDTLRARKLLDEMATACVPQSERQG